MHSQAVAGINVSVRSHPEFPLDFEAVGSAIFRIPGLIRLVPLAFVFILISRFACGQAAERHSENEKPPVSIFSYTSATAIPPMPLAERIRRGVVPRRGMVSTGVDGGTLFSGDGTMMVELAGNPLSDEIIFHHERILQPWKRPFEAPKIANVLPQVKKLILAGHYREALELSLQTSTNAGLPPGMMNHSLISPFTMRIEIPKAGKPKGYLRTLDFESGEIGVHWSDDRGDWVRQTFVSRPDHLAVQYLVPPKGQTLDASIAMPFVEKTYPVSTRRQDRAIAGFSMGGVQTLNLSLWNPEKFDYVFPMATGYFPDGIKEIEEKYSAVLKNVAEHPFKVMIIGRGKDDTLTGANSQATRNLLDQYGVKYEYKEMPGAHSFVFARRFLASIFPLAFR